MGACLGTSYRTIPAYYAETKAAIFRSFNSSRTALGNSILLSSTSSAASAVSDVSPSHPTPDLEAGHQLGEQNIHLQPSGPISGDVHQVNYAAYHFDWTACLGTGYRTISAYCAETKAAICSSFNSLRTALGNSFLLSSTSPTLAAAVADVLPSRLALDLEASHQLGEQNIHLQPGGPISGDVHHLNYSAYHFDWAAVIVAFCLTSAVEIALQSLQPQIKLPLLMHLLSLAMLFAFASAFVSSFISPTFSNFRHALMLVAKLSIFTAFLFALTVPFSHSLKLLSWSIFGLCLLIIGAFAAAATRRVPHA